MLLLLLSGAVVRYYETKRKNLSSIPSREQTENRSVKGGKQITLKEEKGKLHIFLNVPVNFYRRTFDWSFNKTVNSLKVDTYDLHCKADTLLPLYMDMASWY